MLTMIQVFFMLFIPGIQEQIFYSSIMKQLFTKDPKGSKKRNG